MGYRVAVVGATGNVGREMLNILAEREFPVDEIVALASRKSLGTECSFGDRTLKTLDLDGFDFTGWDIALFAIGSDATKKYAPIAAKAVEDTAFYRYGRLLSRNDVGFDASRMSLDIEDFHAALIDRARDWPAAMLATATHDHKRGEDVRARLAVWRDAGITTVRLYPAGDDLRSRLDTLGRAIELVRAVSGP